MIPFSVSTAETPMPLLQELCRTNIRRILRTNIYKLHPGINKVRKRVKKKPKQNTRFKDLSIVPLSMGMMILRHFDNEQDDENSDDSEGEAQDRGAPDGENASDAIANEETVTVENNKDENLKNTKEQPADEDCKGKHNHIAAKPDSLNNRSEETDLAVVDVEKDGENIDNELSGKQKKHEDIQMSIDDERFKANNIENIDITPETTKSSEQKDIEMTGENDCDKDKRHTEKEDAESDYESGDELPELNSKSERGSGIGDFLESNDKSEKESGSSDTGLDFERILAINVQRVRERIASELGALNSHLDAEINPPDAPSFDTDDDDDDADDDMQVEFSESLKRRARSSNPPRKLRYSSNTSVDTSTTSGIGSYTDDHLDAEMASHMDSQKTSPGTVTMDSVGQQMDCLDSDGAEAEEESDEKEEESLPKETLGKLLHESVELLPLPTALRSYVMYYRN